MKQIIRLFIGLQVPFIAFGQKQNKPFSELNIVPQAGLSWQSTVFEPVLNFSRAGWLGYSPTPYNYERNTQGFGLDAGFILNTNINRLLHIGIKINGRFRYDYIYGGIDGSEKYSSEVKRFLFDYSNSLLLLYNFKQHPDRDWIAEIGFTKNQMGKKDETFYESPYEISLRYRYTSYVFGIGYDVIKLGKFYVYTSFAMNYIPKNFPGYKYRDYMNLIFRASIRFKPSKIQIRDSRSDYAKEPIFLQKKN